MVFLNRKEEIEKIKRLTDRSEASFLVIYGRRRCGKSTLLKKVLDAGDLYYQADLNDRSLQIAGLAAEIGKGYAGFEQVTYPDWEALLINLCRFIPVGRKLILDEFPYLVKNSPELPSVLQRLLDGKKLSYHLIVCGSSQQMMHDIVLHKSQPLYGRAMLILRLKELPAGWIMEGIPSSALQAVHEYALWGGVPRYWEIRNRYPDLETALQSELFDKDSIFFEEPVRLLSDDMRTSVQAYSILALIGQGANKLSEIASRLGRPATDLSKPLANLVDMGYIRKEIPFGESEKNTKRTLYKINDPFFNFFFRYILPNKSRIELGIKQPIQEAFRADQAAYTGQIWEELVRKSVPFLPINGIQWNIPRRWWGTGIDKRAMELDLVAESVDKKQLLIGEAKWSDTEKPDSLLNILHEKASNLPFLKKKKLNLVLFLKNNPDARLDIITPDQVLNALR